MLDIKQFEKLDSGKVFARGITTNSPEGVFMTANGQGRKLRWLAKKGTGNDWAIYCHWSDRPWNDIMLYGDKVTNESNIKKLVPCTKEVLLKYRH